MAYPYLAMTELLQRKKLELVERYLDDGSNQFGSVEKFLTSFDVVVETVLTETAFQVKVRPVPRGMLLPSRASRPGFDVFVERIGLPL